MTLSPKLYNAMLTLRCPLCGHPSLHKGSWFKTISEYTCDGCHQLIAFGYDAKLALFAGNAR